jgi:hypothetical protein
VPPVKIVAEELAVLVDEVPVAITAKSPGTHTPTMDFIHVLLLGALVESLVVLAVAVVLIVVL